MSLKVNMTNGVSINNFDNHVYTKAPSALDAAVKLAGEEAKDRLYESKHKKKLVRVLTVIAYVFFVSLAAIMLSLYYILIWSSDNKGSLQPVRPYARCDNIPYAGYQQPHNIDLLELRSRTMSTSKTIPKAVEQQSTYWGDTVDSDISSAPENKFEKSSALLRKLYQNKFLYNRRYMD